MSDLLFAPPYPALPRPATCIVSGQQIQTFDTVGYSLPQAAATCQTLLAMDCAASPAFAVTLSPLTKDNTRVSLLFIIY